MVRGTAAAINIKSSLTLFHIEVAGGGRLPLASAAGTDGQPVAYGVRPEHLSLASAGTPGAVAAEVTVVEPTGAETELLLAAGDAQIVLVSHGRPTVSPGDKVHLAIEPGMVHVFDQKTGARLIA